MDRMLPCRWGARLFAVLVLAAVASPAGANETVYDQDGYKLVVGIHAALGGFTANSIDFGAGNVNSRAPLEGPFAPSQRRADRQWFEGFGKPFAEIEMPFFGFGHAYGLVSAVGALTLGSGDPTSSLAPQGARSTTSDSPRHLALEDLMIGWHSVELFTDSLGEDAVEISGGRQSFVLGDAFLLGSGVANGFTRAAVGLEPRTSFDRAAILKVNTAPLRVQLFHLESRTDQDLMRGFDPPKTKFVGVDLALFKSGETAASSRTAAGEKEANQAAQATETTREKKEVPDVWTAGFNFLHVYNADSTPETFSFPSGEASPTLSINGNRNGLDVYSGYLQGAFFSFNPDILLHSQFVIERNDAVNRRVSANAWYVEPGYRFSALPWTPQLNLRYAHFSGDPNTADRVKQSYDPLFVTGGDRGFGSWTQGEIFGKYIGPNSNLNVKMAHLKFAPIPEILDLGAIYYNFDFDKVAQFNDPRITGRHAADEVDLYAKWSPTEWFGLTGVLGFAVPGAGLKQAAQAFIADNAPIGGGGGRTMALAELILEFKY
jgi:hypothetical protein